MSVIDRSLHSGIAVFQLLRPLTSLLAGGLAAASLYAAQSSSSLTGLFAMFGIGFALCMFGFAVNDLLDIEKDSKGGRTDKPLVIKSLSVSAAQFLAVALGVMSLAIASSFNSQTVAATSLGLAGLILYSPAARFMPLLKGFFTGLLTCLPMLIGYIAVDGSLPTQLLFAIVVFISGREILIDVEDSVFDQTIGLRTIPIMIGTRLGTRLGLAMMIAGMGIAFLAQNNLLGYMITAAGTALISALIVLLPRIGLAKLVAASRLSMLLTLFTLFAV